MKLILLFIKKYEEIVAYIKHVVWKFVKNEPEQFKLLDVRHNVMKNLILGDCVDLIRFILFGCKNSIKEEKDKVKEDQKRQNQLEVRHIPRNILWPGITFIRDDDLDLDPEDEKIKIEDNEKIRPENNMELAIYLCKGNFHLVI